MAVDKRLPRSKVRRLQVRIEARLSNVLLVQVELVAYHSVLSHEEGESARLVPQRAGLVSGDFSFKLGATFWPHAHLDIQAQDIAIARRFA
eukprot:1182555-Prymnesium_polylepis.1